MGMKKRSHAVLKEISLICLILFCLAMIGISLFGGNGWLHLQEKNDQYKTLERQVSKLSQQNEALKTRVEKLKKDPKTMEHEIRKRMSRVKPGETVYQVTKPEGESDERSERQ